MVSRLLSLRWVESPVRWLVTTAHLSDRSRQALFVHIFRRIEAQPNRLVTHQVPGGAVVRGYLAGSFRALFWTGQYEVDSLPLFTDYARTASGILDIGAAEGEYALFAAAVNPTAVIIAFEPSGPSLALLTRNVAANRDLVGDRLHVRGEALDESNGSKTFYELGGVSSLNAAHRVGGQAVAVDTARGDDIVREVLGDVPVTLIKIDVESTEPAVLRGLAETIRRDRPAIFCEVLVNRTEADLQALVDEWGYRTYWLSADGPVERAKIVGDLTYQHLNWLFLPSESLTSVPPADTTV